MKMNQMNQFYSKYSKLKLMIASIFLEQIGILCNAELALVIMSVMFILFNRVLSNNIGIKNKRNYVKPYSSIQV